MTDFYIKGFATHAEAVAAMNQLLEDVTLDDSEAFSIDCYILKTNEVRSGVIIVPALEDRISRAEYEEER